jgi:hypothetical protein
LLVLDDRKTCALSPSQLMFNSFKENQFSLLVNHLKQGSLGLKGRPVSVKQREIWPRAFDPLQTFLNLWWIR